MQRRPELPVPFSPAARKAMMTAAAAGVDWKSDPAAYDAFVGWHEATAAAATRSASGVLRREAAAALVAVMSSDLLDASGLAAAAAARPPAFDPSDRRLAEGLAFVAALPGNREIHEVVAGAALERYVLPLAGAGADMTDWCVGHRLSALHVVLAEDGTPLCAALASRIGEAPDPDDEDADPDLDPEASGRGPTLVTVAAAPGDPPAAVDALRGLVGALGLDPNEMPEAFGGVLDAFGTWHGLDALPDDLVVPGHLSLRDAAPPASLVAGGVLTVSGKAPVVVGPGMRAASVAIEGSRRVRVASEAPGIGSVVLRRVAVVELPERLLVLRDGLHLEGCGPVRLPATLLGDLACEDGTVIGLRRVEGDVDLDGRTRTRIPDGAVVRGSVRGDAVSAVGERVSIGGDLDVDGPAKGGFDVGADARIAGCLLFDGDRLRLRERVRVGETLDVAAAALRLDDRVRAWGMTLDVDRLQVFGTPACEGDVERTDAAAEAVSLVAVAGAVSSLEHVEGFLEDDAPTRY